MPTSNGDGEKILVSPYDDDDDNDGDKASEEDVSPTKMSKPAERCVAAYMRGC